MLLKNKEVAIIGGGPGGLTLARLLQQAGAAVKVYERDANQYIRPQGSSLDLHHGTGLKAMEAAGLLDAFRELYRRGADKTLMVNGQMEVLFDDSGYAADKGFGNEYFRPEIDRGPLRDLLIASLTENTVIWDAKFSSMEPLGSGWEILFDNGTTAYADVVIAADGARSRVRKYITDNQPIYAGVTALEGTIHDAEKHIPNFWKLINGGSLVAMEKQKIFFFITRGDGALTFLMPLKKPENWLADAGADLTDRKAVAALFKQEFAGWSLEWQELFDTDALNLVARPWYYYAPDQQWEALPNLTMIGDAAHLMPPNGEGANQAMADALELSEALCSDEFSTIREAIAAFEKKMLNRCAIVAEETFQLIESMHAENNLQFFMDIFKSNVEG